MTAFAGATYSADGDIRRLARRPDLVHLFVAGYREALRALRADGTVIKPALTRAVMWIPEWAINAGLRWFFDTKLAVVGGQAHALAAADELRELADELRTILRRTGVRPPANDRAYAAIAARADHHAAGDR